jgi:hypothetical protein
MTFSEVASAYGDARWSSGHRGRSVGRALNHPDGVPPVRSVAFSSPFDRGRRPSIAMASTICPPSQIAKLSQHRVKPIKRMLQRAGLGQLLAI